MDMDTSLCDESVAFAKWKELSIPSLRKIQKSLGLGVDVSDDALSYVNGDLIFKLLRTLLSGQPRSILDVEEKVKKTIPSPADKFALDNGHSIINEMFPGSKKNFRKVISSNLILFPVQEVHSFLVKEVLGYKIELQVTAFLLAIIEWVSLDIFRLSGNYVKNCRQTTISTDDIKVAMCADNLLVDLFSNEPEAAIENDGYLSRVLQSIIKSKNGAESSDGPKTTPPTYDECVKELIHEEQQFIKDLNLIIKVFREPFVKLLMTIEESSSATNSLPSSPTSLTTPTNSGQWSVPSSPTHKTPTMISQKDIDVIFSNVLEVHEFAVNFLCSLEDALEATSNDDQTNGIPKSGIESIGACFEEAAENVEFDVFLTFAFDITGLGTNSPCSSQERLNYLLQDIHLVNSLNTRGGGFLPSVRYVLPKLLCGVIYHCFTYFDYIKILRQLSPSEEDRESFSQAEGAMHPLRQQLERITQRKPPKYGENYLRLYSSEKRRNSSNSSSTRKIHELVRNIEGIDQNHNQFCNEYILDGHLGKYSGGKRDHRSSERHAFLFDGLLLLCKPATAKRSSSLVSSHQYPQGELKLKEKCFIRKMDVIDHPDTDFIAEDSEGRLGWSSLTTSASSWTTSTTSLATIISNSTSASSVSTKLPTNSFEISSRDQSNHIVLFAKSYEEKVIWMSNLILLANKSMLERQLDSILGDEEKKNPLKIPSSSSYRFSESDQEDNILFEENKFNNSGIPLIRGATLIKLIERLTFHQHADPTFVRIFLTTYRSFCSSEELLDCLVERFEIPDIESTSREEIKRFKKEYCQPVQFRVLNVIRHWVDQHYYDFARDPVLLQKLVNFLERLYKVCQNMKKWVDSILKTISRKKDFNADTNCTKAEIFTFSGIQPPIEWWLTRKLDEFNLITIHPIEFGRQLTMLEFELFKKVKPSELVGCAWTKKDKEKTSPNLLKMIHFSTTFTYYLEQQIVDTENFEERVALVSRIIEIMQVLQRLNNFNGMLEIVSAINSAAVYRLEHTMSAIPKGLKRALDEASELNSEHNRKYQEQLRSINPPCVPFWEYSLDPLADTSEKEFSDYLYSKSLEIEPRGAGAPNKFARKWPDLSLKSPGIKPPSVMTSTLSRAKTPFANFTGASFPTFSDTSSIQQQVSPTASAFDLGPVPQSPSTPLTPPSMSSGFVSDHSVFAHVMIGGVPQPPLTPLFNTPPTPNRFSEPSSLPPPLPAMTPPPLPPRTRMRMTSSCSDREESPPPLPPRGIAAALGQRQGVNRLSGHYSGSSFDHSPHHHHQAPNAAPSPSFHHSQVTPPAVAGSASPGGPGTSHLSLSRRNSALDLPLAPPPTPRRHSQSASISLPPHHPPPPPPPTMGVSTLPPLASTSEEAIPQLPPRTYRTTQHLLLR
ncbi:Protein son of sevenless [Halotydeus destructor]|nr:Protein son of sevenless [Halotydeus destructor]